jgi:glycosyltransferase involved in cell wall biosynthesis
MIPSVVHVVNNLDRINSGIWGAAIFGSSYLQTKNVKSYLFVCRPQMPDDPVRTDVSIHYLSDPNHAAFMAKLSELKLEANNVIVMTHGCWLQPTRMGFVAKRAGYKWIYVPQGMLEPWSMQQKKWKKKIYFSLFEKRWAVAADIIRAVSINEYENLSRTFAGHRIERIENGVKVPTFESKATGKETFLFMARLHHKKGIVPLVEAWHKTMAHATDKELIIAGPDEGELSKIQTYIKGNLRYVGPQYGDEKIELLRKSHYYILPSYSEGFPSSVVEAMSYGAIPLISPGCNFQAVYENELGYRITPLKNDIAEVLSLVSSKTYDHALSLRNHEYIKEHNSEERIGEQLIALYEHLLGAGGHAGITM